MRRERHRGGAAAAFVASVVWGSVALGADPSPSPHTASPAPSEAPPPRTSDDLVERARALFDAVVSGRAELADPFFFPREPFLPLKDVKDPGRYHQQLLAAYHHDVRELHAQRRSWDGAAFTGFELGTPSRWVKPGEEWNKLGYFRTFDAKLSYEIDGKTRSFAVHTIISWDGRWYVTHLAPIVHAK
ncbi:MAG TPA: hypothetical protein VH142_03615 [Polyangiaceae bacterium]|jgi:hypothetical protein|nr:hypothetical protein [Polyangiaceae bacterium]